MKQNKTPKSIRDDDEDDNDKDDDLERKDRKWNVDPEQESREET